MKVDVADLISIIEIFAKRDFPIASNSRLLEDGIIDSLNLVQIISEIEAKYDLKIGAMDISFEDFESPALLAEALEKIFP